VKRSVARGARKGSGVAAVLRAIKAGREQHFDGFKRDERPPHRPHRDLEGRDRRRAGSWSRPAPRCWRGRRGGYWQTLIPTPTEVELVMKATSGRPSELKSIWIKGPVPPLATVPVGPAVKLPVPSPRRISYCVELL